MKNFRRLLTLLAFTTVLAGAQSVLAEESSCGGHCKDKKECHCKECKCEKGKECSCNHGDSAGGCGDKHEGHSEEKK